MNENKKIIREFISKYVKCDDYSDKEDLFKNGYVNSLFALELVLFVESRFSIKIENQELNMDNFRSIQAISTFIDCKKS